MSEANIKRKNCLHLFANIVIAGYATKIKSCHWCSIYYWKKFFLSSLLGVKDPFILFEKIIKFKSYRMQKFIVYPWSSLLLLLQNTGVGIIADIWYWPLQCRGAGVTAPYLTPPSLSAKMEQPLEETLMRCTTERCSCCSVGCCCTCTMQI